MSTPQRRLLQLCALRRASPQTVEPSALDWSLIARETMRSGGVDALFEGEVIERSRAAHKATKFLRQLRQSDLDRAKNHVEEELRVAERPAPAP